MKKLRYLLVLLLMIFLWSCGGSKEDGKHNYEISYHFNEDYTMCEGLAACTHCDDRIVENVPTVYEYVEPTCSKEGSIFAYAEFSNPLFSRQEYRKTLEKTEHQYEITYSFNAEYTECAALAICSNCGIDVSETVETDVYINDATCDEDGHIEVTARFNNPIFDIQHYNSHIDKLNHEYKWFDEVLNCEEKSYCEHYECLNCGLYFDKNYNMIYDIEIESPGHKYKIDYEWNEDYTECVGHAVCEHNASHEIIESARVRSTHKAATCVEAGYTRITATFRNYVFEDLKYEYSEDALGHEYIWKDEVSATCTDEGVISHYECGNCGTCFDENYYEITNIAIETTPHTYVDMVCTACGRPQQSDGLLFRINADR